MKNEQYTVKTTDFVVSVVTDARDDALKILDEILNTHCGEKNMIWAYNITKKQGNDCGV